ncbi:ABC transporter permease [Microvirga roseola]|uniref:ABC transporter permease n=1 Tax=Microvirga roseola TaxID=2883126 RepID=UPI001E3745CA|nr:ABC transporter permease [Microvirga roseola]
MTTVPSRPLQSSVAIEDVTSLKERSFGQRLLSSQPFWVTVALLIICVVMAWDQPEAFATADNFYNITRNFAFIGIMAVGMTAVILTGGIDLSVGSIMGLVGVVCGLVLHAEHYWAVAIAAGLLAGAAAGAVNGFLIAYVGLPAFVVTLGMLSVARSLAVVLSENRMIYEFGPWGETFNAIGGGSILGVANPAWALLVLALIFGFIFNFTAWGNYLYAIGSNETAARLTGVPVRRIKMQAYIVSGLTAALASVLTVGWQGSAINALGQGYELRVIASTVIGGADLMGGQGGAYGAVVGAALIEVIRNSLLMAGVDANWQGAFVGLFIVLAVLLQRIRGKRSA